MLELAVTRPLGHELDVAGDFDRFTKRPIAGMPGISASYVPEEVDYTTLSGVVLDQMRSNACVWFAVAMALFLRGKFEESRGLGPSIPMPSMMQGWVLAQWTLQRWAGVPKEQRVARNVGSTVSAGLEGFREFGIASSKRWPLDASLEWPDIGLPADGPFDMPLDVDVAASVAKLTGDYGANGANFPIVARAALAQGHFPVQAFDVDESFFDLSPANPVYRGTEGRPVIGRHMMVCDGYKPGFLRFRGSYGPSAGDAGWIWVPDEYSASSQARDGAVITATPRIAE